MHHAHVLVNTIVSWISMMQKPLLKKKQKSIQLIGRDRVNFWVIFLNKTINFATETYETLL